MSTQVSHSAPIFFLWHDHLEALQNAQRRSPLSHCTYSAPQSALAALWSKVMGLPVLLCPICSFPLITSLILAPCLREGDASIDVYKHTHTHKLSLPLSSATTFGIIILAACFCGGHRACSPRLLRLPLRGQTQEFKHHEEKMSRPSAASLRQSKSWHATQWSHSQS